MIMIMVSETSLWCSLCIRDQQSSISVEYTCPLVALLDSSKSCLHNQQPAMQYSTTSYVGLVSPRTHQQVVNSYYVISLCLLNFTPLSSAAAYSP